MCVRFGVFWGILSFLARLGVSGALLVALGAHLGRPWGVLRSLLAALGVLLGVLGLLLAVLGALLAAFEPLLDALGSVLGCLGVVLGGLRVWRRSRGLRGAIKCN